MKQEKSLPFSLYFFVESHKINSLSFFFPSFKKEEETRPGGEEEEEDLCRLLSSLLSSKDAKEISPGYSGDPYALIQGILSLA